MPLNDDSLGEILIRLPAESLIRSRAVCKRWRAIIDEKPPFFRAHQHHPINKNIIIITIKQDSTSTCYSLDLEALSFSNGHQTIAATPLDFPDYRHWSVVGACKGLALTDTPLGIWNPLTHEQLDLPLPTDGECGHVAAAFGLGYDYVTDDYKAVSILSTKRRRSKHQFDDRTDVYSLKSDSWKTIASCTQDPKGHGVFVCGALNWLSSRAACYDQGYNKIIALDLGTEKYTLLQMPRPKRDNQFRGYDTVLGVLGGCLILCDSSYENQLDVWVMKDYGDEGSWIELFSIDHSGIHDGCLRAVGFIMRKDEEDKMRLQVFLDQDTFEFFLFDVKTNTKKRVFIQGHYPNFYSQQIFPGTKFCLHDVCGGGGARPKTSSTSKNSADLVDERIVFCLKDVTNDSRCDSRCTFDTTKRTYASLFR